MCSDYYTNHFVQGHALELVQFPYGFARFSRCDICELACIVTLHCAECLLDICLPCASERPEVQPLELPNLHPFPFVVQRAATFCPLCHTSQTCELLNEDFRVSCVPCALGHKGPKVESCGEFCTHASTAQVGNHFACCGAVRQFQLFSDRHWSQSCSEHFAWQFTPRLAILYEATVRLHQGLNPNSGSGQLRGVPVVSMVGLGDFFKALVCVLSDWAFKPNTDKRNLLCGLSGPMGYERALGDLAASLRPRALAAGFDVREWRCNLNKELKNLRSTRTH